MPYFPAIFPTFFITLRINNNCILGFDCQSGKPVTCKQLRHPRFHSWVLQLPVQLEDLKMPIFGSCVGDQQ